MRTAAAAIVVLALAGACSDNEVPVATTADGQNAAAPAATGQATVPADSVLAFGLTARQIEDADIVDASGRELGDVEWLVTGPGGELTALAVEIEDSNPDQHVSLPLDGLEVVQNGDDRDLRTAMTMEQLRALPAPAPRR